VDFKDSKNVVILLIVRGILWIITITALLQNNYSQLYIAELPMKLVNIEVSPAFHKYPRYHEKFAIWK